jgi:hypothetical protein
MSSSFFSPSRPHVQKVACLALAAALIASSGCSSAPASTPAKSAGTGALIGGVGGAVVGNNTSMGSTTGILGGVAAGAIVGGIVGMVQDAKERKEQDKLAQERAYSQDLARKRKEEAARKAANEEELAIAQGFHISEMELADLQKKVDDRTNKLKALQAERATALNKKKSLDEAHERLLTTEAEIARLEEELARLKGEGAANPTNTPDTSADGSARATP